MGRAPWYEQPPQGVASEWCAIHRAAVETLKEHDLLDPSVKPLLDEYVYALVESNNERVQGSQAAWDRNAKRAAGLADQLGLTAKGRKAIGVRVEEPDVVADGFDALDDELAPRRGRRSA